MRSALEQTQKMRGIAVRKVIDIKRHQTRPGAREKALKNLGDAFRVITKAHVIQRDLLDGGRRYTIKEGIQVMP